MTATFFFFVFDIILLLVLKKTYYKSAFFVLDIIGTFSLLLDIGQINSLFFNNTNRNEYAVLARAGRVSILVNRMANRILFLRNIKGVDVTKGKELTVKLKHEMQKD